MLTYNDCLGLSDLTQEEVAALARIKHLPEVVALEMGCSLCRTPQGARTIVVQDEPLPRTPTGKVQKFLLAERHAGRPGGG